MNIPFKETSHDLETFSFKTKRTKDGVVEFWTKDVNEMAKAMGYIHAHDRKLQLLFVRIIAKARLSEVIKADESTLEIDKFMSEMAFHSQAKKEVQNLSSETKAFLEEYAKGVDLGLKRHKTPLELKAFGYKPEPWKIEDSLATIKLMSYIGLAQTQQEVEKLIIQFFKSDASVEKIKSLFTPHLDDITEEQIQLIKKAKLFQHTVPENVKFMNAIPKVLASNNWVLGPKKTTTSTAYQCNDPHLEVNRLPAIWYEFIAHTADQDYLGVNMPGVPGVVMGRNKNLSFGFTYGFMDLVDYFIEEIKDNKVRVGDSFQELSKRTETIQRKSKNNIDFHYYESANGVIEHDGSEKLEDGFYFARSWSGHNDGAAGSAESLYKLHFTKTATEVKEVVKDITISCNWLFADDKGDIGYQQSGRFPHRVHSGLFPLEGWKSENQWKGIRPTTDLATIMNPESGFITTANNDMNQEGKPLSINMPMGSYRADRISDLIHKKDKHSINDMKIMQRDLFSNQSRDFLLLIKDLIPHGKTGDILKAWDCCYDKKSQGAVVFEEFYKTLFSLVFGDDFIGNDAWDFIQNQTHTLIDFYPNFDRIFLETSDEINTLWFSKNTKEDYFKKALKLTCEHFDRMAIPSWGAVRNTPMNHILFDGKLPKFTGFDYGPIPIEGSRATIVQGALYESHGRTLTFCPSYRFVSDLGTKVSYTVLAGGVSDRRFSKLYTSDVKKWLNFQYKELNL